MQSFMDWISEFFGSMWTELTSWQKGWLQWLLEKAQVFQETWIYSWVVQYAAPFFTPGQTIQPDGTLVGEPGLVAFLIYSFDILSNYFQFLNWVMPLQEVITIFYVYFNVWIALRPIKTGAHLVARFLF